MRLTEDNFSTIEEHFFSITLENGFKVILVPKQNFRETVCMLTVGFGSLDNSFTTETGEIFSYPEGVAHFLEHKVFEMENNKDAAIQFTNLGADLNAFTSFDRTAYFFSSTSDFDEALSLLQTFVVSPHFTYDSVKKEKDIIRQEIDLYQDDPEYQLYQGILENLYPETVLAKDIAGNKDSINRITLRDLKENHHFFYHPKNMTLLIVGDINKDEIIQKIIKDQEKLSFPNFQLPIRNQIVHNPVIKTRTVQMDVALPKLAVAYRGRHFKTKQSLLKQKIALRLLLAMLLGWTSNSYQNWYDAGQIDDSFDIEIEVNSDFQFIILSSDTFEPIALSNKIRQLIKRRNKIEDISEEHLQLIKKEMYGDFIKSLDSTEHLANQFMSYLTEKESYFDIPDILRQLTFTEVIEIGNAFFDAAEVTDFTIVPK